MFKENFVVEIALLISVGPS